MTLRKLPSESFLKLQVLLLCWVQLSIVEPCVQLEHADPHAIEHGFISFKSLKEAIHFVDYHQLGVAQPITGWRIQKTICFVGPLRLMLNQWSDLVNSLLVFVSCYAKPYDTLIRVYSVISWEVIPNDFYCFLS